MMENLDYFFKKISRIQDNLYNKDILDFSASFHITFLSISDIKLDWGDFK